MLCNQINYSHILNCISDIDTGWVFKLFVHIFQRFNHNNDRSFTLIPKKKLILLLEHISDTKNRTIFILLDNMESRKETDIIRDGIGPRIQSRPEYPFELFLKQCDDPRAAPIVTSMKKFISECLLLGKSDIRSLRNRVQKYLHVRVNLVL